MPDLPWDFVTLGVPASVQTKSSHRKQQWKADVAAAATAVWPAGEPPLSERVQIHVTFFYDSAPLDVDNMLKPIQDALIGIVYDDDNQLTDTHGHVRDINKPYRIRGMSPALAAGFSSDGPFVHVRIERPSAEEELP